MSKSRKIGKTLVAVRVLLILIFAAYIGWRFGVVPILAWKARMITWDFIALIILYSLVFLVPGVISLWLGIRQLKKR